MTTTKTKVREMPKVKKVIGGLVYNTETASVLYRYNSDDDYNGNEERYSYEYGLLQNVWGNYFSYLWHEAEVEEGYRLNPLTKKEAIKWAERHCNWLVEEIFGKLHEAGEGAAYTPKINE